MCRLVFMNIIITSIITWASSPETYINVISIYPTFYFLLFQNKGTCAVKCVLLVVCFGLIYLDLFLVYLSTLVFNLLFSYITSKKYSFWAYPVLYWDLSRWNKPSKESGILARKLLTILFKLLVNQFLISQNGKRLPVDKRSKFPLKIWYHTRQWHGKQKTNVLLP